MLSPLFIDQRITEAFMQSQRSVEVTPEYLDPDVRQLTVHWSHNNQTFAFDVVYVNSRGSLSTRHGGKYRQEIPTLDELGRQILDFLPCRFIPLEVASQLSDQYHSNSYSNARRRPSAAFMR